MVENSPPVTRPDNPPSQPGEPSPLNQLTEQLRHPDPNVRLRVIELLWEECSQRRTPPLSRTLVEAVGDPDQAVSDRAAYLIAYWYSDRVTGRPDIVRDLASESPDRKVRLRAAAELLTLVGQAHDAPTGDQGPESAPEGGMGDQGQTDDLGGGTARTGRPVLSLTVAVVAFGVALVLVGCGLFLDLRPAAFFAATVCALISFAFVTRWVQQADRSRSRFLQGLERVRRYVAHEDAATPTA